MKKIITTLILVISFFSFNKTVGAFGECDQYGPMAIYDGFSSCKCMSGYVFGKDYSGNTSCVSASQACKDQYGHNATSDYTTNQCKCNYGYSFGKNSLGKTQCISDDQMCKDDLGYGARYNSLYDSCECGYGDIIINGKCTNASNYCSTKYGMYSDYNSSSKKCGCDDGYTFNDSNQCVKKQNNVYFTLKELDTDNKLAVIKSDYDYSYYSIRYNTGCYSSSFKRYLNQQIVVNLGTDYDLDTWDKIVLQDDDETCDIVAREKVSSSYTLFPEQEEEDVGLSYAQITALNKIITENNSVKPVVKAPEKAKQVTKTETKKEPEAQKDLVVTNSTNVGLEQVTATESVPEVTIKPAEEKKVKWYSKIFSWFKRK